MEADYGSHARYLVKKPFAPQGLTSAAQNVLFQSLDKVSVKYITTNLCTSEFLSTCFKMLERTRLQIKKQTFGGFSDTVYYRRYLFFTPSSLY